MTIKSAPSASAQAIICLAGSPDAVRVVTSLSPLVCRLRSAAPDHTAPTEHDRTDARVRERASQVELDLVAIVLVHARSYLEHILIVRRVERHQTRRAARMAPYSYPQRVRDASLPKLKSGGPPARVPVHAAAAGSPAAALLVQTAILLCRHAVCAE